MNRAQMRIIEEAIMAYEEAVEAKTEYKEDEPAFYKNLDPEYAAYIIDEIIAGAYDAEKALRLIDMFVNNLITVGEIEMLIY